MDRVESGSLPREDTFRIPGVNVSILRATLVAEDGLVLIGVSCASLVDDLECCKHLCGAVELGVGGEAVECESKCH